MDRTLRIKILFKIPCANYSKRTVIAFLLLLVAYIITGCSLSVAVSNRNTTTPVMLGPVRRVSQQADSPVGERQGERFNIKSTSMFIAYTEGYSSVESGLYKPDPPMIRSHLKCPECPISVTEIRVISYCSHVLFMVPFYLKDTIRMSVVAEQPAKD